MRAKTNFFLINGKPMLVPDEDVTVNYEDLDGAESGRDQSGIMHRLVVRQKLSSWVFTYSCLTEAEKNYIESLFGEESTFLFTHPDRLDSSKQASCTAYRSKYSINWKNARTGLWSGYSFRITQC